MKIGLMLDEFDDRRKEIIMETKEINEMRYRGVVVNNFGKWKRYTHWYPDIFKAALACGKLFKRCSRYENPCILSRSIESKGGSHGN